ncbi:hypothetical protein LJK88_26880 [Paenibacillus sp. P26]|nr:hypothetical protein LJK88_26880 [Paenibacillus sp. P26]
MKPRGIGSVTERERYWISCVVKEPGFELPPKIEHLGLGAVTAFQHDTWSLTEDFDWDGVSERTLEISHYLAYFGIVRVQVQSESREAWEEWSESAEPPSAGDGHKTYMLTRSSENKTVRITIAGNADDPTAVAGTRRIRVICHTGRFDGQRYIGTANGYAVSKMRAPEGFRHSGNLQAPSR